MYKRMRLETDVGNKSDRIEWGHAKYHRVFRPDQAYELVVEWLTSSGAIVFDLVSKYMYEYFVEINNLLPTVFIFLLA